MTSNWQPSSSSSRNRSTVVIRTLSLSRRFFSSSNLSTSISPLILVVLMLLPPSSSVTSYIRVGKTILHGGRSYFMTTTRTCRSSSSSSSSSSWQKFHPFSTFRVSSSLHPLVQSSCLSSSSVKLETTKSLSNRHLRLSPTLAFVSNHRYPKNNNNKNNNNIFHNQMSRKQQKITITPTTTPRSSSDTSKTKMFSTRNEKTNEDQTSLVSDMLHRIRECNAPIPKDVMEFCVDGKILGKVTPNVANLLCSYSNLETKSPVFQILSKNKDKSFASTSSPSPTILTLAKEAGNTCKSRTDAIMSVMEQLRDDGCISGWRDELYPIAEGFYDEPLFLMERVAAPFVGALEYGVHINGLVDIVPGTEEKDDTNQSSSSSSSSSSTNREAITKMWMARRSKTKSKYPGMIDHIVAGGQPANMGLMDNVIKECMEEAGVPEDLVKKGIKPAGAISYETHVLPKNREGKRDDNMGVISRCVLFCYDLTLPNGFIPKVVDGEMEHFFLWTMEEVMECIRKEYSDPMKPNCYPVVIDYLMREGYLSSETPGYLDVLRELRSGDCC